MTKTSPSPSALWQQIAQALSQDIALGVFAPAARLPTAQALAQRFGVNRHTVRQALAHLSDQGLVQVAHGSGCFVADFAVDLALGKRTRHSHNLAAAGLAGGLRLLHAATVPADAAVARALALRKGTQVLALQVLGEAGGRPLHYSERYFPKRRFAGMAEVLGATGSISKGFAAHGVADYTRRGSAIAAHMPSAEVAAHLAQAITRPVLYVESVNVDEQGQPIEFAQTSFAGDRVKLQVNPDE